ncbi:glycosyltransferase [Mesorhizobium sp. M1300]
MIIDADDEFVAPAYFTMPVLAADSYVVGIDDGLVTYERTQLIANRLPWRYEGVLHEYLVCLSAKSVGHLELRMRRNHDGRRRRDPSTYLNDVEVLQRALITETDPALVARYTFYLAQSFRDCGDWEAAIENYLRRAELGFWEQEVFVSLLQAARLMEHLGRDADKIIAMYGRATAACPSRAEGVHGASRVCRRLERYEEGYNIARRAIGLEGAPHALFSEPWIYSYGLLDEFSVLAYWTQRFRECLDICLVLLARDIPAEDHKRIACNAQFALGQLCGGEPTKVNIALPNTPKSWEPTRAQGGTELMVEGLYGRLGNILHAVNLCVNLPSSPDGRPLVVWIHHDVDQLAIQWLQEREEVRRVDRFVFVSTWQQERFIAQFGLARERCIVLKNATEVPVSNRSWIADAPLKMAYTSAPYRGLSVLLETWEYLRPTGAELHIWSSHKLYGPEFDDTPYEHLYARARRIKGVFYHGIVPHSILLYHLSECHFLTYPSTFAETSCIAAIDAMAAGCRVICPNYGALPETVDGFGRTYCFSADPNAHSHRFADVLSDEIRAPWQGNPDLSSEQQDYMRSQYNWPVRVEEWRIFLESLL